MKDNYMYLYDDPFMRTFMMPAVMPEELNSNSFTQNQSNNSVFVNSKEGFLRGNMEENTYVPYKNMTYIKPELTDERQRDLYNVQQACFAAHDANLYLDTHPNDSNMIRLYNNYKNEEKRLLDSFEKKYGPINLSDSSELNEAPWKWINNPWPWNKENTQKNMNNQNILNNWDTVNR